MPNKPTRNVFNRGRFALLVGLMAGNVAAIVGWAHADAPATQPAGAVAPAAAPTTVVDLRKTVEFLASDALEGRASGSSGNDMAAGFIAGVFTRLNLEHPAGWNSYFQPFKITSSTTVDSGTTLSHGGGSDWSASLKRSLALQKDFQPLSFSSEGAFDAPVVFAGYGVSDKERKYDDYADLDVKGKVVLAMRFEPHDKDGNSAFTKEKDDFSPNAAIPLKAKHAQDHGALALVLVNPPNYFEGDEITPFARQMQFDRAGIPVIQVKQPVAEAMLAAAKLPKLSALQSSIDSALAPQSKPLEGVNVAAQVKLKREEKDVRNVAAVLPGKGPHADEYIVVGAHYDHLGHGGRGSLSPFSKDIHHGADDNASGTSAMLKLAERFAEAGPQDRSILFIAFTGEEVGLLGSAHFVKHPPVPLEKIAAMVNFDMVGRVRENKLQIGGSGTAAGFEKMLQDAASGSPLKLNLNSKGGMGPSDHMSFAIQKVPVLFFFSGLHLDYHRPTDTADKVNYEGLADVVDLGQKVVAAIAKAPKDAYVGTFDSSGMMGGGPSGSGGTRVSLGVVPDYSGEETKGVLISGTSAGSAAEKAGLKGGDVLVKFDDMALNNLNDLTIALNKSKPGQTVTIKLMRGGAEQEVKATLTERKSAPMPDDAVHGGGPDNPHAAPATGPATKPHG